MAQVLHHFMGAQTNFVGLEVIGRQRWDIGDLHAARIFATVLVEMLRQRAVWGIDVPPQLNVDQGDSIGVVNLALHAEETFIKQCVSNATGQVFLSNLSDDRGLGLGATGADEHNAEQEC